MSKTSAENGNFYFMLEDNGKQPIMITWTKRLLLTITIMGLLATNVLTLTSTVSNAALSGFMSTALGVATVTEALRSKIAKQDKAIKKRKTVARKFGHRLAARTKRVASLTEPSV